MKHSATKKANCEFPTCNQGWGTWGGNEGRLACCKQWMSEIKYASYNAIYVHIWIVLYVGHLTQPIHFCISYVICKAQFSMENTHFLDLNFKFALVHYHAEMALTRSAEEITPIIRSTQAFFMLYYYFHSIAVSLRRVLLALALLSKMSIFRLMTFLPHGFNISGNCWQCFTDITSQTYLFTWLTYAQLNSVTSLFPIT